MEIKESRIKDSDFQYVNTYKELAFVTIHGRSGFCSFTHTFICVLAGFSCSLEDYERYRILPWPKLEGAVTLANFLPTVVSLPQPEKPKEKAAQVLAALAAMRSAHAGN
jgi:hypothetical protein